MNEVGPPIHTPGHPSESLKNTTEFGTPAKAGRMLLRLLRAAQPISRVELARRLGINRSTVTDTFKPLIASGLVVEEAVQPPSNRNRTQGRPPSSLSFNSDRDLFAGIHIGARNSQVGLAALNGEIIVEDDFETPGEPNDALAAIRARVERLLDQVPSRTLGLIGVSVPGLTDADRQKLIYAPHLGWRDIDLAKAFRFTTIGSEPVPVIVENDSTAAALYEARLRLRHAQGDLPNNFILVRSGTGIGVGLVLGGEVYRGIGTGEGSAGEFGHMTIVAGGKPCACGNRGCWERYAAASAASSLYTGDRVQVGRNGKLRYVDIVARAEAGELRAQRTLERIGEYLGIGIRNLIIGLGIPRVIVSGRVVYGWKFLQEPLRNAAAQGIAGKIPGWSIEHGEPRGAGLGGALEVAADDFLTTRLGV